MRCIILTLLLVGQVVAQCIEVSPLEFRPLINLPWKEKPVGSLQEQLRRIFLEPDPDVRYPVLAAYLRQIPVEEFGAAFDLCVAFEGNQCPAQLIAMFLPIWAERDPQAAWKRTDVLFELQDNNWLGHDSWSEERIMFRNLDAMRQSDFWIDPRWLENFLAGLNRSALDEAGKQALKSAFMAKWSPVYASPPSEHPTGGYALEAAGLIQAFETPVAGIHEQLVHAVREKKGAAVQVLLRRWLVARPNHATLIGTMAEKLKADTPEFFLTWLNHAPDTLIEWVDAHAALTDASPRVMGMLLSRVPNSKREEWIKLFQRRDPEGGMFAELLREWAGWSPEDAMSRAIASQNAEAIARTAEGIVYGGFSRGTANTCRHGLNFIRDFDLARLPKAAPVELFGEWYILMEQWGTLDIGEAARYGLDFMLRTDYTPRDDLLKLFKGDDAFGSDSDMIDRTFCALRMWAALKPGEMKAWIASRKDVEMREALTWLLEHPWGHESPRR